GARPRARACDAGRLGGPHQPGRPGQRGARAGDSQCVAPRSPGACPGSRRPHDRTTAVHIGGTLNKAPERTVVTVEIAGEEYNIRALASPEYTKDCAAYVDRTLSEIMRQGSLLQAHKGAILAALALADELFQTR